MKRRSFLKGIFGAAVVATMPKSVVDQIEKLPEPPPINKQTTTGGVIKHLHLPCIENCLYIYDNNNLIGQSAVFDLNYKQGHIPIYNKYGWVKEWTGKYKKKSGKKKYKWVERTVDYIPAAAEWDINSDSMQWFVNPEEIFALGNKLDCLIKHDKIKITGGIYITQIDISAHYLGGINHSAKFVGNGTFLIENDDN